MTEKPTKHTTAKEKETAAQVRREALALRYVLALPADECPDACAKLAEAARALPLWLRDVRREVDRVAVTWPDACAMLSDPDRKGLKDEAAALEAAGVDLSAGVDPAAAREAYNAALAETKRAGEEARIRSARKMLDSATGAQTADERLRLMRDASHELARADVDTEKPLAEVWQGHLDALGADEAGPGEVLRLNEDLRGSWAVWINDNLGTRRGLEPGETFILGGGPEAGKTSFAALLAVDAMAAWCPVLFWQLELSQVETLEHLIAQLPEPSGWWTQDFKKRRRRPLPKEWAELLTVPRWPDPEEEKITKAMKDMARETERARRADKKRHKCRGLVIVDYAQLLTLGDPRPREAKHDILATAASRLAKAAAETGACLLLLSQLNKEDQRNATTDGTALGGADLARMAHRVALMQKADENGKPCSAGVKADENDELGERRIITWTKRRGMHYTDGHAPVKSRSTIWDGGKSRALHDGEEPGKRKREEWRMPE